VLITNSNVATKEIINYARPTPIQAYDAFVGVVYDQPPGRVKAVLRAAVAGATGVVDDPAPKVYVDEYGDFAIRYRVRFWMSDYGRLPEVNDAVLTRLWYALRREGMRIPFPIRDVRLRSVPDDEPARQQAAEQEHIRAALRALPLLAPLDDSQLTALAAGSRRQQFTAGEHLFRQGEAGDSLMLITRGRARVLATGDHGLAVPVASRTAGDVLGEMSLLTGEPRSATVVADDETEVIVVDHDTFAGVLAADPTIVQALGALLAARTEETAEAREAVPDAATVSPRDQADLLDRIYRFFGLGPSQGKA
jgi:CRP-like cAMP-binding protein